ncbi:MAG: type III-B CRISPR-associated protein Cas10/Cmr2 [Anaerolineae bacterium]|nr:type III-B CRISPR-associated protein Cas10/Cmr2 [Anaerolineae bacterium]MBL8105209.1 type III-B CRISPR-associated protein Cas10/Cmr2 [Anaerolineales bacterium]MCC7187868.1 type III-B CRISPR-associated protein Cas10/Cmr2 [Anaerolineales bacterium]
MKHLIIFSVGPVQDFINTARRSRDLWYGSWMLSELSKAAAKNIADSGFLDWLVFPHPADIRLLEPASQYSSPNKVIAVVDNPERIATGVRTAVGARLQELWADAKSHIHGRAYNEGVANQQVDDLLEFYWVSVPFEESNAGNYAEARNKAEMFLAARKTIRNFQQPTWSAGTPKSSLDGARESVIPRAEYAERNDTEDVRTQKTKNLYTRYRARRGEQLSGVDLLKRLGRLDSTPNFKSTSDMAALPFVEKFNQKNGEAQTLIEALRAKLPVDSDTLDGAEEGLVFESRFEDAFPTQKLTPEQRADYLNLLKKYAGNATPTAYYALLAADGDFMGKIIDGQTRMETHQNISQSLARFVQHAREIVGRTQGVLIYSGGDDVLAYLPLPSVLDCANELQSTFGSLMEEYAISDGKGGTIKPSLSVGIVIVHHLEPLSNALQLVRKAEKDAKVVEGKNGLAIILSKRSGVDRSISDKFSVLHARLTELITYARDGAISGGTAYELHELHQVLFNTEIPPDAKAKEAIRIVERKRESGSDQQVNEQVKASFAGWIQTISLDELAREMIVAKELAGIEGEAQ